jgi:hypothetical protein
MSIVIYVMIITFRLILERRIINDLILYVPSFQYSQVQFILKIDMKKCSIL